ncbi:MAG: fasciclin domain-containing protein [Prevotella sp.]|nr:fasciclin domain-containing protein [Prevotella sp.]
MNKNLRKIVGRVGLMAVMGFMGLAMTGCNPEPDESDLFTATGETATDYIARKSELSSFMYILQRVGLDRNLSSYGEYTCFIPNNDAVETYIHDLYNDAETTIPHNGMTEESLEGLTDSLCNDIAKYHLVNGTMTTIDMGGGSGSITTMLRIPVTSDGSTGQIVLNKVAMIVEADSVVTNGVVHVLNNVIPRNTRLLPEEMDRLSEFSIFNEALKLTGLSEMIRDSKKNVEYTISDIKDVNSAGNTTDDLYHPEDCKVMYTVFAEPDSVMHLKGINSVEDLAAYANRVYGDAAKWYNQLSEVGLWNYDTNSYEKTVSTGTDYKNRNNALNMFVAYHILYAGMPEDELVYERNSKWQKAQTWNYTNGASPYDYYETMLPNTLLKIWQPQPLAARKTLYINRYVAFNTLTDELGTMGSDAMHTIERQGVRINRTSDKADGAENWNIQTFNGYIHSLQDMLVYDEDVPKGVLHERMRFDSTTFLPEFINNGFRMSNSSEISALNGGGSGARIAFPLNYFDNVVSYTPENRFRYNVKGAYNAWQADTFQGWGDYDLAIKLPPLPTNTYEFRIFYTPMGHGGMMQFYLGNSSSQQAMMALDIPLDVRVSIEDPRIGWTIFTDEDDLGVATDAAMRNRGYMRGIYSYADHAENGDLNTSPGVVDDKRNMRYTTTGNNSLRKIMGRVQFKQSEEHWFRIKNVIANDGNLARKWQFDYIEFVPVDVVDNDTYSEDWF